MDGDFCEGGNSTDYEECNTQECPSSKHNKVLYTVATSAAIDHNVP